MSTTLSRHAIASSARRFPIKRLHHDERGQATAEYALVLLGVAAVALLVLSWATHTNKIGDLFNTIFDTLLGHVKG
jgi:Flp pilus assembly pilin Flp